MKSESEVQSLISIEGPYHQCVLMRNNSGALKDETGRMVRYGLGNVSRKQTAIMASSDLIGITTVKITPEMVGQEIGIFTAVECKAEKWKGKSLKGREQAQLNFINWVKFRGGIAGFANSVDTFKKILQP